MSEEKALRTIHWLSLASVAVLYALLCLTGKIRYSLNDDMIFLRSFAGCVGGIYERFNVFTHTLLAWFLHGLSVLFPTIAWFSVLQLTALFAAAYAILSAVQRIIRKKGMTLLFGWAIAMMILLCFGMVFMTCITFTTTAALLCAASVWQMLAIDLRKSNRHVIWEMMGSFFWLVWAYMLRDVSALPGFCFWMGACLCRGLAETAGRENRRALWHNLATAVGFCMLTMGLLMLIRVADINLSKENDYYDWFLSSEDAMDYNGIRNADTIALQSSGWSPAERNLVMEWYFMEDNITKEAFEAYAPYADKPSLPLAIDTLNRLLERNRNVIYFLAFLGFCGVGALLCAILSRSRQVWVYLAPFGTAFAACAALIWLASRGRLPVHAAAAVLLPACALMLWLWLEGMSCLQARNIRQHALFILMAVFFGILTCKCALMSWNMISSIQNASYECKPSRYTQLETYALHNPDKLFIADNKFDMDTCLFPDWREGKATNVMYNWGSWNNHSPGYRAQLACYGLDDRHFTVADFCRDNVRLVTACPQIPPQFLGYLQERVPNVRPRLEYMEDGFTIYAFDAGPGK